MLKLLKEAKNKSLNSKTMGVKLEGERVIEWHEKAANGGRAIIFFGGQVFRKRDVLFLLTINQLLKIFVGAMGPIFYA